MAVDRVYQLIQSDFYDDGAIFRVVENYVAQFGINSDSSKNSFWKTKVLPDEPVITPNEEGTISFARGGPGTRGTQLFINIRNNSPRLDTLSYQGVMGFPVIGKIIENKAVVDSLYSGYGNNPRQDSIQVHGNNYLKRNFPKLDYILSVAIIK
jgi:cyclophilin family peptidyl-prolyl cis-trans isomerase